MDDVSKKIGRLELMLRDGLHGAASVMIVAPRAAGDPVVVHVATDQGGRSAQFPFNFDGRSVEDVEKDLFQQILAWLKD